MRLWSLHPRYLDGRGLVALWREGLLAQQVLRGRTRGYRHHPQLNRFLPVSDPARAIAAYLWAVAREAQRRGYEFDVARIKSKPSRARISVTRGQLRYELMHLRRKLWKRDRHAYAQLRGLDLPAPHPMFDVLPGPVADWEVTR